MKGWQIMYQRVSFSVMELRPIDDYHDRLSDQLWKYRGRPVVVY